MTIVLRDITKTYRLGEQDVQALRDVSPSVPSLIFADEPTGALDTRTSVDVMALLQQLNAERGMTIVLISHEPYVAVFARRVLHIRDGMITRDKPQEMRRAELATVPPAVLQPILAARSVPRWLIQSHPGEDTMQELSVAFLRSERALVIRPTDVGAPGNGRAVASRRATGGEWLV